MAAKRTLAVVKFASCDGCQLTLLDCEDALLDIAQRFEIALFLEATRTQRRGPYDLVLVEGSITTAEDAERIRRIRRSARTLVAIGACATAGGIQALRNLAAVAEFARVVYPRPELIETLPTSSPIRDHVRVDFELRGCPIDKGQLLEVLSAFLNNRRPEIPAYPECIECKLMGTTCVMVSRGLPCLGPVTVAGCGNLCPRHGRGCYGCFGPVDGANTQSLAAWFRQAGVAPAAVRDLFHSFNAAAPAFRRESEAHV